MRQKDITLKVNIFLGFLAAFLTSTWIFILPIKRTITKLGGLNLSRSGHDQDSRSWHFKNKVSTIEKLLTVIKTASQRLWNSWQLYKWCLNKFQQDVYTIVQILNYVSDETLNLDSLKNNISTVSKFLTVIKITSRQVLARFMP